jgi:hypothetical protein
MEAVAQGWVADADADAEAQLGATGIALRGVGRVATRHTECRLSRAQRKPHRTTLPVQKETNDSACLSDGAAGDARPRAGPLTRSPPSRLTRSLAS